MYILYFVYLFYSYVILKSIKINKQETMKVHWYNYFYYKISYKP